MLVQRLFVDMRADLFHWYSHILSGGTMSECCNPCGRHYKVFVPRMKLTPSPHTFILLTNPWALRSQRIVNEGDKKFCPDCSSNISFHERAHFGLVFMAKGWNLSCSNRNCPKTWTNNINIESSYRKPKIVIPSLTYLPALPKWLRDIKLKYLLS